MNDPRQHLIHLTSRGERVQNDVDGAVGHFRCFTKQPIKDVNKFGLLHYSIPKTIDVLDERTARFDIRIRFVGGHEAVIPVELPRLDYYNCVESQRHDNSTKVNPGAGPAGANDDLVGRIKDTVSFDEVLQTTINWAIMDYYRTQLTAAPAVPAVPAPVPPIPPVIGRLAQSIEALVDQGAFDPITGERIGPGRLFIAMLARISCAVARGPGTGVYLINFGYRGWGIAPNMNDLDMAMPGPGAAGAVAINTGAPCATVGGGGVVLNAGSTYHFVDPLGIASNYQTCPADPAGGNRPSLRQWGHMGLTSITFERMSGRVQMMLGASGPNLQFTTVSPLRFVTRGRIRVVDYPLFYYLAADEGGAHPWNGIAATTQVIQCLMTIPPNLDPPSNLFLQLVAQGTRSKILGQLDERGGWAIPTPSELYVSKWDNFPTGETWDVAQVRNMPVLNNAFNMTAADFRALLRLTYKNWAGKAAAAAVVANATHVDDNSGLGYNFDPLPFNYHVAMAAGLPFMMDNWDVSTISAMVAGVATHRASRFIRYGRFLFNYPAGLPVPQARNRNHSVVRKYARHLRGDGQLQDTINLGFGRGSLRASPVFTIAMIEPNWIFTTVENSTVQTFDVHLLFGDTSEPVETVDGHPTTFSIIASP